MLSKLFNREPRYIQEIKRMTLHDDDILIVKTDHRLTTKQAETIREQVLQVLQGTDRDVRVLVMPVGFDIEVLEDARST